MKLGHNVVVTLAKVILKFGSDQMNICYGSVLLQNEENPRTFSSQEEDINFFTSFLL